MSFTCFCCCLHLLLLLPSLAGCVASRLQELRDKLIDLVTKVIHVVSHFLILIVLSSKQTCVDLRIEFDRSSFFGCSEYHGSVSTNLFGFVLRGQKLNLLFELGQLLQFVCLLIVKLSVKIVRLQRLSHLLLCFVHLGFNHSLHRF